MTDLFRIGVISDTHGHFDERIPACFEGVDLIIHAGDIGGASILERLRALAPVEAVVGNVDGPPTPECPNRREIETPLGRIGVTHGHLPEAPSTDRARMVRSFASFSPRIVIYGHSHIPKIEAIEGVRVFNPGAAGRARFRQRPCVGLITGRRDGNPASGPEWTTIIDHRYLDLPSTP